MGVWTFQAQDITYAQLYNSVEKSTVTAVVVVRCSHLKCLLLYNMRNICHSYLVFPPSDDCTLNNHFPNVPVVPAKQEPFQPLLELRFGAEISFQIVTPHGRVS